MKEVELKTLTSAKAVSSPVEVLEIFRNMQKPKYFPREDSLLLVWKSTMKLPVDEFNAKTRSGSSNVLSSKLVLRSWSVKPGIISKKFSSNLFYIL